MSFLKALGIALGLGLAGGAAAEDRAPPAPKLVVAVAVDQFSADLFAQHRRHFSGGFARLAGGAVFPSGYQSHASTETCPGHSTILTGARPARTGIIANMWVDPSAAREDKNIYCVEDETVPGTTSARYEVSFAHLKVPTLGDRLKALSPASRVVSVSGKDRSAVMMAGRGADEIWWWKGTQFMSLAGRPVPSAVAGANRAAQDRLAKARPPSRLPDACRPFDVAVPIDGDLSVGRGRLAHAAGDRVRYVATPEADAAVLDLAAQFVKDMKLGRGPATDVLALGLSATDYVGHYYGTAGAEMCIHLLALDGLLGRFFTALDRGGIDYVVALTADHGGHDVPERNRMHGVAEAQRTDGALAASRVGPLLAAELGLKGPVLYGDVAGYGDFWIDPALDAAQRESVLARAVAFYGAAPQVAAVLTRAQVLAAEVPRTPPDTWTLAERVRASFDPARSGDFVVLLKPRVTPIPSSARPTIATHGSPWDYDRRVPILFWRRGLSGFEQPLAVETVDIVPTLAAMIGLPLPEDAVDGRCLFGC